MKAEIICVGTELLMGNFLNTNATYLSEKLTGLGIQVMYHAVIGDNPKRLRETFLTSYGRSDLVILSGGLGPTEDDLTKEIVAQSLNLPLELDRASLEMIRERFLSLNRPMTKNNEKQAMIPQGAKALYNRNGTAPGILIDQNGKIVVILPGPPNELNPMFEEHVLPYLQKKSDIFLVSEMIKICGKGESGVETELLDLIDGQTNPTIATYCKVGEVYVRITASADSEEKAKALLLPIAEEVKKRFGKYIFTTDENVTLEEAIGAELLKHKKTLSTAESCTGGLLAGRIVNVSGISDCFKEGFVTYANEAKMKHLGVSKNTLDTYGAVSEECAREMCAGLMERTEAHYSLVTTGVAGPNPSEGKPAGLVYIGVGTPKGIRVKEYHFYGNRQLVRDRAVVNALTGLWLALKEEE